MSKKKFTDGLESLFSLPPEEEQEGENVLVVEKEKIKQKKKSTSKKRSSGKSFTSDLDSLFSGVIRVTENPELSSESKVPAKKENTQKAKASKNKSRLSNPIIGLEALLRSTTDPSPYNKIEEPSENKRVTFTFNRKKLTKLKKIAKLEKLYLKDIIGGAVSEYIEEYEHNKGNVE